MVSGLPRCGHRTTKKRYWDYHKSVIPPSSDDVPEEVVEVFEGVEGDGFVDVYKPTEGGVVVHGGNKCEGAGRSDEIVTLGQEAEVFTWIAVGERKGRCFYRQWTIEG